jgi:hypothetical protein
MKTASLLICTALALVSAPNFSLSKGTNLDEFTGIYDGLSENMEFQFTSSDGKVYIFDEVDEDLDYDLYDETYIGQKFKVSWQKRVIEILDDEDEPTGQTEEIKVIVGLKKL